MTGYSASDLRRALIWIVVFLSVLFKLATPAAGAQDKSSIEIKSTSPLHSASTQPAVNRPPPDRSWAVEQYVYKGMPAPNRTWTIKDYDQALAFFQQLATTDPTTLPRFRSPRSGELFARLTSSQNISDLRNEVLPLNYRLSAEAEMARRSVTLFMVYLRASKPGAVFDSEIIEGMRFQLELTSIICRDADRFAATLNKLDLSYPKRMEGLAQVKQGAAKSVDGLLRSLEERSAFRPQTVVTLAQYLNENLPPILAHLPKASIQDVPGRVRVLRNSEEDPVARATLSELLSKLDPEDRTASIGSGND